MQKNTVSAVLAAVTAATLMGTLGFFVRESGCGAALCAFARFGLGLLLLVPLLLRGHMGGRDFRFSALSAVSGAGISLCILFYFMALKCMPVGLAALMVYAGPILAAAGEALWTRRLPSCRDALPLLLSLAGLVLVFLFAESGAKEGHICHAGVIYSLLSAAGYAVYLLLNSHLPATVSLGRRTFWQFAAGVTVLALPMLAGGGEAWSGLGTGWPYLLAIGVCHGLVVMVLIAYAARRLSATQYGTFAYLEPAVAVLIGCQLYGEQMAAGQWCGFALVLLAALAQGVRREAE